MKIASGTKGGLKVYTCLFLPGRSKLWLSQLKAHHLQDFKDERITQGKSHATVNLDIRTLQAMIEWGVSKGYLKENVLRAVKLLREDKSKPSIIAKEDLPLFLSNVRNIVLRNLFDFMAHTGLRRGEALFLRRDNVFLVT